MSTYPGAFLVHEISGDVGGDFNLHITLDATEDGTDLCPTVRVRAQREQGPGTFDEIELFRDQLPLFVEALAQAVALGQRTGLIPNTEEAWVMRDTRFLESLKPSERAEIEQHRARQAAERAAASSTAPVMAMRRATAKRRRKGPRSKNA